MARSRCKFKDNQHPYFMTCTVVHWLPIFSSPHIANIVIDSLKFLQQENVKIYAWVMLENHIHLIAQSENISIDIARFKAFTAKKILALPRSTPCEVYFSGGMPNQFILN